MGRRHYDRYAPPRMIGGSPTVPSGAKEQSPWHQRPVDASYPTSGAFSYSRMGQSLAARELGRLPMMGCGGMGWFEPRCRDHTAPRAVLSMGFPSPLVLQQVRDQLRPFQA